MHHDNSQALCQRFLADKTPTATTIVRWGRLGLEFEVGSYLGTELPPPELTTSVRGVVRLGSAVVVLGNRDGRHFLPGGRLEPGEQLLDALAREIDEECGLSIARADLLGFTHFHHLKTRPAEYPYPYPDMFHVIYRVDAQGKLRPGDLDGYETDAWLMPPDTAAQLEDTEMGLPFLKAATRGR